MRALLLPEGDRAEPCPGDVPEPTPGPGEVLVEIDTAGINHVDLLLTKGRLGIEPTRPHILGIEGAGHVSAVGAGVDKRRIGKLVTVYPYLGCGRCRYCYVGEEQLCPTGQTRCIGLTNPGTFAQRVTVPDRNAIPVPESVSPQAAAACTITGMTAYRLLVTKGAIRTGETVLVRAVGSGVGVMAAQIAKAAGAHVIGTAGSQEKLEHATELGVDHTINHTTDDVPRRIKELTSGNGVDLVVDYVGAATWADNVRCMGRSGRLVLCGAHTGTKVELDLWHLFAKEHAISGSYGGTRQELEQALKRIEDGQVTPVIGTTTNLASATQAIDDLETRNVFGKVLIKPE